MGSFETMGIEEIAKAFEENATKVSEVVPAMLKAGAEVVKKRQKEEAERFGLNDTGGLIKSIKPTRIKKDKNATIIDVYPQGKAPHGNESKKDKGHVRYATIGYIAEYGIKRGENPQPARPWLSTATERAEPRVREVQLEIWEREMNK